MQSWTPPSGGEALQQELIRSLRLSVASDNLYARWAGDLAAGDQSGANRAYSQAQANDKNATNAKKAFIRDVNAYREQNGLAPIPTDKLF